jgi:hypothetical protein
MSKLLAALALAMAGVLAPLSAGARVFVAINIAPPALPVYEQPLCPGDGYLWTPGYWGWDDVAGDYYWVPGTWLLAPQPGLLWTPGWWGWGESSFVWHAGYWGAHVGFYGGIDYGFGYDGFGYHGGYWSNNVFNYNRNFNRLIAANVHNSFNSYDAPDHRAASRVSYHGGSGGTMAQATAQQRMAESEAHFQPTPNQALHEQAARSDRAQFAAVNQGRPPVFATAGPGGLHAPGAMTAGMAPADAAQHGVEPRGVEPLNRGAAPQRPAPLFLQHDQVASGPHAPLPTPARQSPQPQFRQQAQPVHAVQPAVHAEPARPLPQAAHLPAPAAATHVPVPAPAPAKIAAPPLRLPHH